MLQLCPDLLTPLLDCSRRRSAQSLLLILTAQSFDDAALGLLLGAAGKARTAGGDVVVVCTEPRLRERLMITGFDKAIIVRHSIAAP